MADFSGVGSNQKSEESSLIVALRIRPMNDDEILQGATPVAHRVDDNLVILMDPVDEADDVLRQNRSREKRFMFDLALDGQSSQEEVYDKTCKFLIPGVMNGYNATVFAYGATGAGKTYTMLGKDDDPGIMARALTGLFTEMKLTQHELVYKVTMSYLEIYNELIRDLLNPGSGFLDLREDQKGVQIAGLSEHSAASTEEVMSLLKGGNKERTQEPTAANKTSSRSHAVLIVSVKQRQRLAGVRQQVRVGKLYLIDLAGSERAANTQNRGKRMVEGAHINRSLLALGNCINALSDKNGSKYINYRDSKLTRLLKDALGGNCKTVMIAHISPASFYFDESRNTLTYADRAKNIKTKVRQNVLDMTLHISQYSSIITELREEIRRLRLKVDQQPQMTAPLRHLASPADDNDFVRLKHDLINVFRTQMDLRQSLMELTNTEADIHAETTRLELLINRLENEKVLSTSQQRQLDFEDRDRTNVDYSLKGSRKEICDINQAKDELESLENERRKSEKMKASLDKELSNASNRTKKIEEDLRIMCSSKSLNPDQQEIVSLLNKLHAIQVENAKLQSNLVLYKFDARRRDFRLDWQLHHAALARLLVHQQRALIDDNDIGHPPELNNLYDVYEKQSASIHSLTFLPPIDTETVESIAISSSDGVAFSLPPLFSQSSKLNSYGDGQLIKSNSHSSENKTKFFAARGAVTDKRRIPSPRSSADNSVHVLPSDDDLQRIPHHNIDNTKDDEIEDLILNGDSRKKIVNNTRGIAQLAAFRRTQRRTDDNENKHGGQMRSVKSNLTQSRLAQHDSKYMLASSEAPIAVHNDDLVSSSTTTFTDVAVTYQGKNKPRRRQAGTRLARPQPKYQRSPSDTNHVTRYSYSKQQAFTVPDNAVRGSGGRVMQGAKNNRQQRTRLPVPQRDVNFDDDVRVMSLPGEPQLSHRSLRHRRQTPGIGWNGVHSDDGDFISVTGLGLQ